VRLRYGPCIAADAVVERDAAGRVTKLRANVVSNVKGASVIHWVDAATSVPAEVRLYERLFKLARPEEGGVDFLEALDRNSLEIVATARLEASLARAEVGSRWQLERVGYFVVDEDSKLGALVLNRIVTLRETTPLKEAAPPAEKKQNAKAATRPKSKSPAEYRAEARVRDPELAAAYAKAEALGLPADQADLGSGDRATAHLFTQVAASSPELVAKWIINELPRALAGKDLADAGLDPAQFAELIAMLKGHEITAAIGKSVLAQLIATGRRTRELAADAAATPAGDLGSAVEAVLAANPDKAAQYKAGKTGLLGFFVGQVMKSSPSADAAEVNQAIRDRLR
jgi:glutaminyl-tRNA synthetase